MGATPVSVVIDNSNNSLTDLNHHRRPLIPDGVMLYINLYISIGSVLVISAFGTVSNLINMIVFVKLGLKDSMTIGLFALAFSDFTVTVQTLFSSLCYLADFLFPASLYKPLLIQYVSVLWAQDMMYVISNWTTTLISLERCVCVISPFRVKTIFRKSRTIFALVCIYLLNIASYCPVFASHSLSWSYVNNTNSSTYGPSKVMFLKYTSHREIIYHTVDIINGAVVPVIQQGVVIICTVCLSSRLKTSSKIRHSKMKPKDGSEKNSRLCLKETRLLKVLFSLTLIMTVCNAPRFIAVYATLLIPEMYIGKLYSNTYVFLWVTTTMFASLNASVNIFVYLVVNVQYRSTFRRMFYLDGANTKP